MIQSKPLLGRKIVLTRDPAGSSRLASRLEALGASTLCIPLINVVADLDKESAAEVFKGFASYEWMLFTSRNGVKYFFEAFLEAFEDIRSLGFIRIAVVGQGTVEALRAFHLKPDLVAETSTAAGLAASLAEEQTLDNTKILVVTGNRNSDELTKSLWEERAIVDTLRVYSTHFCDLRDSKEATSFRREGADALVFASASAVEAFGRQADHLKLEKGATVPVLCSFGPSTTGKMKKSGIPVTVEADSPGLDGLVNALVDYFLDKD